MASVQPYLKFYPKDWIGDSALRMCSLAARGLWIDLLALMADAQEFGVLPFTEAEAPEIIANACGGAPKQIDALLRELKARGVYSVREDGCIVSRRLIRDHATYQTMSALGQRGAVRRYSENDESAIAKSGKPAIAKTPHPAIAKNDEIAMAENAKSAIARKLRSSEAQKLRYGENEERGVEIAETALSPARRIRPEADIVPEGAFGADEGHVAAFVAAAANENKTGTISAGRIQSLRRALLAAREEFPHAFHDALLEANTRGKPSINYLRAIAKNHEKHDAPGSPSLAISVPVDDEPLPRYIREAAELHARTIGAAANAGLS